MDFFTNTTDCNRCFNLAREKIDTHTNFLYIMITATAITTSMTPKDPPIAGAEGVSSIISFSWLACKIFQIKIKLLRRTIRLNANPSKGLNLNIFFKLHLFTRTQKSLMVLVKDDWKDVASLANLACHHYSWLKYFF